jgi:hypothetical protein
MRKHKLIELQKTIEEKIGSLREEVEIATNIKLSPIYIADRRDEIEFLEWVTRIIQWVLDQGNDKRQQLGVTKMRLELEDTIKFENMLHEKIQELEIELEESISLRESDILINEIDTLKSVLGCLSDLKYGDKTRAKEIVEDNNKFEHVKHPREKLIQIQDMESEINAQI